MLAISRHPSRSTLIRMHRCWRREIVLTPQQDNILRFALMRDRDTPWCNNHVATTGKRAIPDQMVQMGLLKMYMQLDEFRWYRVTGAGAAAVGLWLAESS
jgi:hypothetical protein